MDSKDEDTKLADSDAAVSLQYDIGKALRCRDHALKELVDTEKTYVDGLGKLVEFVVVETLCFSGWKCGIWHCVSVRRLSFT